ncbi:MAG: hypothetical protein AAB276_05575 [Pseudomonadota bacterium]
MRFQRSQLAALFQHAMLVVTASQGHLLAAQSALAIIDQELARRGCAPRRAEP